MSLRTRRGLLAAALVTGYAAAAAAVAAVLVAAGARPATVVALGVLAALGLAGLAARAAGRAQAVADRLADDVEVVVDANPGMRLAAGQAGHLARLAAAVNRLAERRQAALEEAAAQASAARAGVESERNRLAALMAQLSVAVVVCNSEGTVLLYNDAARDLVGDPGALGLGRSVFGVVDRGLVAHARERLGSSAGASSPGDSYTATTLRGDRLLRVHLTSVRPGAAEPRDSGFVLVLEDLTSQVRAGDDRERTLRRLTEDTRAGLGSILAAVESVLEFPDLQPAERQRFLEVVREEAGRLGRRLDQVAAETGRRTGDRAVGDISTGDLVAVVAAELERAGLPCRGRVDAGDGDRWVRADGHAVARTLCHLAARLPDRATGLTVGLSAVGRHAQLDLRWQGEPVPPSELSGWLDEPLAEASTATAREVAERHAGELWGGSDAPGTGYLRILLPLAEGAPVGNVPAAAERPAMAAGRPEFYDFDLFAAGPTTAGVLARRLDELTFTVLDTETTGLDPAGGDRIVSLGAVRVVNGRVLARETFDRLVDPGRPVPAASTAVHGLTGDLLAGQPTIEQVLPDFVRFADGTVLVGHNISFDLRFLAPAARACRVRLPRPALDTLLLHAALYPGQSEHTLEAIASRLGISVVGRHTALGDALVTAEILVRLVEPLRRAGIETLDQALAATRDTWESRAEHRHDG